MNITFKKWQEIVINFLILISIIGLFDSLYLSYSKIFGQTVNCTILSGCHTVLQSYYANLLGIPLAYLGLIYYLFTLIIIILVKKNKNQQWLKLLLLTALSGFLMSGYFVYLQFFEIMSICIYCMLSALTSTLLFIFTSVIFLTSKNDLTK